MLDDEPIDPHEQYSNMVSRIVRLEDEIVVSHRRQIEDHMELFKTECALLTQLENPDSSIDPYIERMDEIIEAKLKQLKEFRDRIKQMRALLAEEEALSNRLNGENNSAA